MDYKIKDPGLADFGRKEIELAEQEMPGLMALRERYKGRQPQRSQNHRQPAYDHTNSRAH